MRKAVLAPILGIALWSCTDGPVDDEVTVAELSERGRHLFFLTDSCVDCHGEDGSGGLAAPPLDAGITPRAIDYQLRTNPEMAELADALQATQQDLLALSVFIRDLTGDPPDSIEVAALATEAPVADANDPMSEQAADAVASVAAGSERLAMLRAVEDFSVVVDTWERRAREGSLKRSYEAAVAAEFDPGEPKFTPEPGKTYFYENAGTRGTRNIRTGETFSPEAMKVVVGDAETREVIASHEIPAELRSAMHSTALSPGWALRLHFRGVAERRGGAAGGYAGPVPRCRKRAQGRCPHAAAGKATCLGRAHAPCTGLSGSLHADRYVRPGSGRTDGVSLRPRKPTRSSAESTKRTWAGNA